MKFTFKKEDAHGEAVIIFNGDSLEEVVAEFEKFLRATGFDLGNHKFALVDFTDMETMHEEGFEFPDDEDEDSGNGSGNNSH